MNKKKDDQERGLIDSGRDRQISLRSGRGIAVSQQGENDMLEIRGREGQVELKILLTPDGPVIQLNAVKLSVNTTREIDVTCDGLNINSHSGISLRCKGDFQQRIEGDAIMKVDGDMTAEARIQTITANLGNVNVQANDDVSLQGERIKLNC